MRKKITLLVCACLAIIMILGACGQTGPGASPTASGTAADSDTIIVGEIDGQPVYKSELEAWVKIMGGGDILSDPNYKDSLPDILDSFMSVKTINAEVIKRGYLDKLTSDQISQAEEYAQTDLDTSGQYNGMTEEEVLGSYGITKDQLIEQYKLNIAGNAAFTDLVGDVKPTEDQIKLEYDDAVAYQKETMDADPTAYITYVNSGTDVYYVPSGVHTVRKLLIAIDSDTAEAISMLRESDYNDQADILLNEALLKIKSKADEIADKIKNGLSFNDSMAQYNEDIDAPDGGYPIMAETTEYPDAFITKAMALTSLGQISDMFATDEGYQIIEYTADVTPGAVDYESVKGNISEDLLAQVQSQAWTEMIDQWEKDHNVKKYPENL